MQTYVPRHPKPNKSKGCFALLVSIFIMFGIMYYLNTSYQTVLQTPYDIEDSEPVRIEIKKGITSAQIADILVDNHLIYNKWVFLMYVYKESKNSSIQSGSFTLMPNQTIPDIIDILTMTKRQEMKVTIPEGYTIAQIDELLASKGVIEAGEFVDCADDCDFSSYEFIPSRENALEGYLFPDTYFIFPDDFESRVLIKKMLNNFENKIEPFMPDIQSNAATLDQFVIMASMVEKESRKSDEKPIVSGILWKRLRQNIHLGVDATMRYYLNDWKNPLTYDDFQKDTTYNTRKYLGLPKTAICNPGVASLKASVNPEKSSYYYYLHDGEGKIHYGRNLDEHNVNKRKYIL